MRTEQHMVVYSKTLRSAFVNNLAHVEQDISLSEKALAGGRVIILFNEAAYKRPPAAILAAGAQWLTASSNSNHIS